MTAMLLGSPAAESPGLARTLIVGHTWDGAPLPAAERVELTLTVGPAGLSITVGAPWRGDPPPAAPVGPTAALWEHEVVELFVAGPGRADGSVGYTEIELGPHGHHLVLRLRAVRDVAVSGLEIDYRAWREGDRWRGRALVPWRHLPPGPWRGNAYAVSGPAGARRYHAWTPVPGPRPDFHQPARFESLDPIAPIPPDRSGGGGR